MDNTVDIKKVTSMNSIGDTRLPVVWTDPEFDLAEPAVYCFRALPPLGGQPRMSSS